jgi:hypothetical protein
LILTIGVFNALLVTVMSAIAMALFAGSGTSARFLEEPASGPHFWSKLPDPVEFAKVVVLLCPLTAVTAGSFGLLGASGVTQIRP